MIPTAGTRLRGPLLALALTLTVGAVAPATAQAETPAAVQLAVEEEPGGTGEAPGPEPELDNTFAPEEFETPWHWWLGVLLTAVTVLAIGGMGLGYWLLVQRRDET